jgi:hypothetical protein
MEQALIQYIDKLAAKPGNESELSNWYLMVVSYPVYRSVIVRDLN